MFASQFLSRSVKAQRAVRWCIVAGPVNGPKRSYMHQNPTRVALRAICPFGQTQIARAAMHDRSGLAFKARGLTLTKVRAVDAPAYFNESPVPCPRA